MNTTNGNFNELDEMKQQMQMLQDKFQKEVTINDRLIQESIRHKMSWNKNFLVGHYFYSYSHFYPIGDDGGVPALLVELGHLYCCGACNSICRL